MAVSPLATSSALSSESISDRPRNQIASAEKQSNSEPLSASELRNQRAKQHNLAILEANQNASLSVSGQPLSLLYQTAINAINAELASTMGDNAVERTQHEGIDTSPEATAGRIVSITMGNFGKFQEHHADLPQSEQVDRFLELVSSGIDKGFGAARDILEGLSVLEGSIAEDISKTYDLVQQGLEHFREHFLADNSSEEKADDV